MFETDVVHSLQFLFLPYSSGWVVRIAEDEGGGLFVGTLALEILKIYLVGTVTHTLQFIFFHFAATVLDTGEEAVVHRSLHQNLLAWHADSLQAAGDGRYYARSIENPVFLYLPLVAAGEPVDDCLVVRIRYEGVAEDAVSYTLLQSFDDAGSCLEIHVCYPHRNNAVFLYQIPFVGIGATTFDDFIKIVFHICFLSMLFLHCS